MVLDGPVHRESTGEPLVGPFGHPFAAQKSIRYRRKLWRSKPLQQPFVFVGLGDHDGRKDGIRDGEQRDGKEGWCAGVQAAVRPAAALQRGRRNNINCYLFSVLRKGSVLLFTLGPGG